MGKRAKFVADSNRVFSKTAATIFFKLAAIEQLPGGYRRYRGFWRESLAEPEIVKTIFYVKCEYLGHLPSQDVQFFFILCA